ncbi:DUF1120 domain-containing protein [Herbaspirillum lusitanum]|uniref:DUF1120 domain-containing protein n=1 Tax=Herbaspirillum lusitanum TaxID=213312 RepID=UPI0012F51D86|nr:DUF1120 domain-containing protein [Herbaspirillum lusitanum]
MTPSFKPASQPAQQEVYPIRISLGQLKMKKHIFLTVLLVMSVAARAADTAELKVAGTVRPAACTLSISGGGIFDYGVIPVSRLSQTKATALEKKTASVTVACDDKAKVALRLADNRPASAVKGIATTEYWQGTPGSGHDRYIYGLGTVRGSNVGAFTAQLRDATGDGKRQYVIAVEGAAGNGPIGGWSSMPVGLYFRPEASLYVVDNWGNGTIRDEGYETFSATLAIQATIDKLSNLPATGEIPLDGSATLELIYR